MALNFQSFIEILESIGLTDVLLPFLLIFVVIFAVLQKTNILGKGKKNYNVLVSIVIGLMVVIPHVLGTYPSNFDVVNIMNMVIPQISLIIIAVLMLLLLLGLFGGASIPGIVAVIAGFVIVLIFLGTTGWVYQLDWVYEVFGTEAISFLVIILVFGLIIWFITSEPKEIQQASRVKNWISELISGK